MYISQDLQEVFTLHLFQEYLLRKAIDYHNFEFAQVALYPTHADYVIKSKIVQNVSFPDTSVTLRYYFFEYRGLEKIIFPDLHTLSTSLFEQIFIMRKGNHCYYFRFDHVSSMFFTDWYVKYISRL